LKNAERAQQALAKLDSEVEREIGLGLAKQGRKIRDEARGQVATRPDEATGWNTTPPTPRFRLNPDGTWNRSRVSPGWPAWNSSAVRSSIKSSRRAWRLTITMSDRAGVIFANAFTKTDGLTPQGRGLRSRLQAVPKSRRGARTGRILVPALRKHYRATLDELEAGVKRAADIIERRING
jgi:hypothetical protein